MVKDSVKSVKGTEFPAFFDQSTSQAEFDEAMKIFYKYRGNLLTGGICVKEYLDLKRYDGVTNEFRVFYANGKIISVSKNSKQPESVNKLPMELAEKYLGLNSPYYTIDYAELADGSWKIIEAGDGSVSGLSSGQDAIRVLPGNLSCICGINRLKTLDRSVYRRKYLVGRATKISD
jgi:hypothetical protein